MWPFKRKLKSYLLDKAYLVKEAFVLSGTTYFMFDDAFRIPSGRAMAALTIYEELRMRCSQEYLEKHCKAMEILLSDPKKININAIAIINRNLKERLNLAPFPEHIYKLASVIFFDDSESPYSYDYAYNQKKIGLWRKDDDVIDFFLSKTELKDLIPSLTLLGDNAQTFFQVSEQVDKSHANDLHEALSSLQ